MTHEKPMNADTAMLVGEYHKAAELHGNATERGDYKLANKSASLIASTYAELRRRGESAQRELLPLLRDPSPGVRLWSASHALEFSPCDAEYALKQLIAEGRLLGLSAEMTLKEWQTGRLFFP